MMARTTHASAVTLALLMTLIGFPKFGAATLLSPSSAQSPSASPVLPLPSSVPLDSTVPDDSGTYVVTAPADGGTTATDAVNQQRRQGGWLWWLLLLPLALLVWWWLKGRRSDDSTDDEAASTAASGRASTPDSVNNSALISSSHDGDTVAHADLASAESTVSPEPSLADRVSSVISADRASINPEGTARGSVPAEAPATSGAALTAGLGTTASLSGDQEQSAVEAAKFDVGQTDLSAETLADVDSGLADLPDGYGDSRIVLLPRDPQWAYVYWDVPNAHKEELRRQGGERLALRFYDVTDIDLNLQNPHTLQQFDCEEMARSWYLPVSVSDRDYVVEIGYLTSDGRWLLLARSAPARIPPVYPSDWFDDQFVTVNWDDDLRDKTVLTLAAPTQPSFPKVENPLYEEIFDLAQSTEAQRLAGSLYGSMQMVPEQSISSYVFPSGVGLWALPTSSMSGIGMSGIGFSASMPPIRPRKFWLVADAELIVYGATEPDATVTVGGQPITLNPDGTFRFQMSFQDGLIDYPIVAIAADGEQSRDIHMEFVRETPDRQTNTKDEATDEWL